MVLGSTNKPMPVPHRQWPHLNLVNIPPFSSDSPYPELELPAFIAEMFHCFKSLPDTLHGLPSYQRDASSGDASTPTKPPNQSPLPLPRQRVGARSKDRRLDPSSPEAIELHYQRMVVEQNMFYDPTRHYRNSHRTINPLALHPPSYEEAWSAAWAHREAQSVVKQYSGKRRVVDIPHTYPQQQFRSPQQQQQQQLRSPQQQFNSPQLQQFASAQKQQYGSPQQQLRSLHQINPSSSSYAWFPQNVESANAFSSPNSPRVNGGSQPSLPGGGSGHGGYPVPPNTPSGHPQLQHSNLPASGPREPSPKRMHSSPPANAWPPRNLESANAFSSTYLPRVNGGTQPSIIGGGGYPVPPNTLSSRPQQQSNLPASGPQETSLKQMHPSSSNAWPPQNVESVNGFSSNSPRVHGRTQQSSPGGGSGGCPHPPNTPYGYPQQQPNIPASGPRSLSPNRKMHLPGQPEQMEIGPPPPKRARRSPVKDDEWEEQRQAWITFGREVDAYYKQYERDAEPRMRPEG
ncbi:hypothetical protein BDD12DRAFT_803054 [Trichophaea hybrida]|nr:hypothetical protein BDD12DRAFT_803054 [Trichophaea hybrida]